MVRAPLFSNFRMDAERRLCMLLVGLTELRRRLSMAVHESLSQRLVVRRHIGSLDRDELDAYLEHRLRRAGCELPLFEPPAVEALFESSRGLPRQINRTAHYALSVAAEHMQHVLDELRPWPLQLHRNRPVRSAWPPRTPPPRGGAAWQIPH